MPRTQDLQVVFSASSAKTANGNGGEASADLYDGSARLRVQLEVTAVAGTTPTLDVLIEDTVDGTNWNTIGTFAQKTGVSREVINITTPFTSRVRARWTIGGSAGPSFTFSVVGFAIRG